MSATLIDGKAIAAALTENVKNGCASLGFTPGLAALLIGDDPASRLYVALKEKACADAGIAFEKIVLPADADEDSVLSAVRTLNAREDIDGILVQLPLPAHLDENRVIDTITPEKDVDGFHPVNINAMMHGERETLPVLADGIMTLLASTGKDLEKKRVIVVANSEIFYEPLAEILKRAGMKPSYVSPDDSHLGARTKKGDVLITAVGKPSLVTGDMIMPGAIVIDIGTTKVGKAVHGDVDAASAQEVAGFLTPVPGGVGPVTVATLLKQTLALAKARRD